MVNWFNDTGYDSMGNTYSRSGKIVSCRLYNGKEGFGHSPEEAFERARKSKKKH